TDFSDGITSGAYTATAVGTYTWSASYSGDGLNNGAIENGRTEWTTSMKASPTIRTNASSVGTVVGSAVMSDSATISGGYLPSAGSVTFTLKDPSNNTVYTSTDSDFSDGITSGAYTATAVGTYHWSASYSGDGLNNGAIDNGQNESATIIKASPSISTSASQVGNVVGSAVLSDSASISGGYL